MSLIRLALGATALAALSACVTTTSDTDRAIIGGLTGAAIADATDNDVAIGAALGAGAGALADNTGAVVVR